MYLIGKNQFCIVVVRHIPVFPTYTRNKYRKQESDEMGNAIHYFINTNSSKGFVSFFKSNFEPLERVIKLDNYPTAIVEELIGKASSIATEKGYQQEIIHSCIDNSIEGIILPQLKTGLLNIPAYIDYGYSVYKLMDNEIVQDMQEALTKSHEYFAKALKIHDDWEKIYITNMNFAKMNQLTSDTILKILGGHTQNKKGSSVNRLFGASTVHGPIDYIENITADIEKRYFIKGRPGTGKSTFLKKIAERAMINGYHVEIYHCAFDPNSLDLVVIRDLGICLFDSTSPHEYFPSRDSDEIIDIYQEAVKEHTDEEHKEQIAELQKQYKETVAQAIECINKANRYHQIYQEDVLSKINNVKCKQSMNKAIVKLLKIK